MPELITLPEDHIEGYFFDDLMAEMDEPEQQRFTDWIWGQTCALHEGKSLVYRWAWERYQAGLPVID